MFDKNNRHFSLISLCLVAICLFSFIVSAPSMAKVNAEVGLQVFADVPSDHWASEYINRLASHSLSIIKGMGDGTFGVELNATRAEFATFMDRVLGLNVDISYQGIFSDVDEQKWYSQYVEAAFNAEIIKGKGDGTFEPEANITRQEVTTVIANTIAIYENISIAKLAEGYELSITDSNLVSDWALDGLKVCYKFGITNGYEDGSFKPEALITRAEVAKILSIYIDYVASTPTPTSSLKTTSTPTLTPTPTPTLTPTLTPTPTPTLTPTPTSTPTPTPSLTPTPTPVASSDFIINSGVLTKYNGTNPVVNIPMGVTQIGNSAFEGCAVLTSVTIPSSVTSIGNSAFEGCTGLTNVTIPSGVISIGNYSFVGCTKLTSVTMGSDVTIIGNEVFYGCTRLNEVVFLGNAPSIGNSVFDNCGTKLMIYYVYSNTSFPNPWNGYSTGILPTPTPTPRPTPAYKVYGINFGPYVKDGQSPNFGNLVTKAQIHELIDNIAPYTEWIRTFWAEDNYQLVGSIAKEHGLKIAISAWLEKEDTPAKILANQDQINNLINAGKAGQADLLIVGSEVLLRDELSESQLIAYINQVKQAVPNASVATADSYSELLAHPAVVAAGTVVMPNYYPYWEGVDISRAVISMYQKHQKIVAIAEGKPIIISESGWPSAGDTIKNAVPSPENAALFFNNFVSWMKADNIPFFYFEAFDEPYKIINEGPAGPNWGIWDKNGVMKPGMEDIFNGKTVPDNWAGKDIVGGPGIASCNFTVVPAYNSTELLQGQVLHVAPVSYKIVVYIKVDDTWWIKPYIEEPITYILPDGSWTCNISTGANDKTATQISAYLIPSSYSPPIVLGSSTLPAELDSNAVANASVTRSP